MSLTGRAAADPAATPPVTITTTGLPVGTLGSPYPVNACPRPSNLAAGPPATGTGGEAGVPLTATGGTPPYTWSIIDGSLPLGLRIDPKTDAITGTPTQSGVFVFDAQVSDSATPSPATVSTQLSLTVGAPFDGAGTLAIVPTTIHTGGGGPLALTYTAGVCGLTASGEVAISVPPGWAAPSLTAGTTGTVAVESGTTATLAVAPGPPAQIVVTGATLAAGQALVLGYGGDGPVAPTSAETDTFATSSRFGDGGQLLALVTSPSVSVIASALTLDGSGVMVVSPKTIHAAAKGPLTFTYTAGNGGLDPGGEVAITLPDGWQAPSPQPGRPALALSAAGGTVSVHARTIVVSGLSLRVGQTFTLTYGGNTRIAPRSARVSAFLVSERHNSDTRLTNLAGSSLAVSVTETGSRSVLPIVGLGVVLVGLAAAGVATARWIRHRGRPTPASRVRAVPHTGGPGVVSAKPIGDGTTMSVRFEPHAGESTTRVERVGR